MRIRIILSSTECGGEEYLHMTTDFDTDTGDFIYPGCTVDSERIMDLDNASLEIERALESDNSWKRQ